MSNRNKNKGGRRGTNNLSSTKKKRRTTSRRTRKRSFNHLQKGGSRDNCKDFNFAKMDFKQMRSHAVSPTLAEMIFVVLRRPSFVESFVEKYSDIRRAIKYLAEKCEGNMSKAQELLSKAAEHAVSLPPGLAVALENELATPVTQATPVTVKKGGADVPAATEAAPATRGFPPTFDVFIESLGFDERMNIEDGTEEVTSTKQLPATTTATATAVAGEEEQPKQQTGGKMFYANECVPEILQNIPTEQITLKTLQTYRLVPTLSEMQMMMSNAEFRKHLIDVIKTAKTKLGSMSRSIFPSSSTDATAAAAMQESDDPTQQQQSKCAQSTTSYEGAKNYFKQVSQDATNQRSRNWLNQQQLYTLDDNIYEGEMQDVDVNPTFKCGKGVSPGESNIFCQDCLSDYILLKQIHREPNLREWILFFLNPIAILNIRNKIREVDEELWSTLEATE